MAFKTINYSTKCEVWQAPRMYKGTAYFPSYAAAHTILEKRIKPHYPSPRIVEYDRGYAVQYYCSGPYYPEREMK